MTTFNAGMRSSTTGEWETPQDFFDALDAEFHFDLDPCATRENAKCNSFFTKSEDGLAQSWRGLRVFMNPPYGREIASWVSKAHIEMSYGALVVGLLPARTDTAWFHEHIYKVAREVRFVRGRLKFSGAKWNAPFPCMVVIW